MLLDVHSVVWLARFRMAPQVVTLQNEVFQANAAKLAAFEADKPRLKGFLHALSQQRTDLKREIAQLQAVAASAPTAAPLPPRGARQFLALQSHYIFRDWLRLAYVS